MIPILAHADFAPARGFPLDQVIPSAVVAVLLSVVVIAGAVRYRRGRFAALGRAAKATEKLSGLPGWAALPGGMATVSLLVAAFGFYWDVSWHIDKGRDQGPFATPAHFFIIIGLVGVALAGLAAVVLADERTGTAAIRIRPGWRAPVGGLLMLICGVVAVAGFPLDDVWHTLFGEDVTLWGPTHIQMIGGASLATLALWVLLEEGRRAMAGTGNRARGRVLVASIDVLTGGAFLLGLSTLQAEFDFGVPQFRQLYHPVLIMVAASIALVTVRIRVGRGGALGAALFFVALRGGLSLLIGPVLGRSTLHFPLYLGAALAVEVAALLVPVARQVSFGLVAGLLVGTFGLAAEWGWSQIWMPLPWHQALWPSAAVLGLAVAVAGGLLGGLAGRALSATTLPRQRPSKVLPVAGWATVLICLALPLSMTANRDYRATVSLTPAAPTSARMATADVTIDPPGAAARSNWLNITAWQGETPNRGLMIDPLVADGHGGWRTTRPFPVSGKWKVLLRLASGDSLQAVPTFLPADPAIPAPEVPALAQFSRHFVPDKQILQREAVGGSILLQRVAYAGLGIVALAWVASLAWGLSRLERDPVDSGSERAVIQPRQEVGRRRRHRAWA